MGETPKSGRFEPRRSLKLALVPAVGLAVVAFTTPAHAEDATAISVVPASLSIPAPPSAFDAVATSQPERSEVQTTISSVAASVLVEPTGDGSAADPVAASEVPSVETSGDVATSVESPANQAASAAPENPSSGSPETPSDPIVPQQTQDDVDRATTAVISGAPAAEAAPEASGVAPEAETAADPVDPRPTRQYQSTAKQYQPARTVDDQPSAGRSPTIHPPAKPAQQEGRRHVVRDSSKSVQILSLICVDIGGQNPIFPSGDQAPKSGWNIKQIGGCIVDLSDIEDLPEDVSTPRECQSASQYQPQTGQYQTVLCEPGLGEPTDASSTVPSDCLPPDVGESADQIAPIEFVIGDANPFVDSTAAQEADGSTSRVTCGASPPAGAATAPAVSSPQGSARPDVEAAAGTAAPASPVSQPIEAPPTSPIESGKQPAGHPVSRSTTAERGSAQAWIGPSRLLRSTPRSVRPKPPTAGSKHRASPHANTQTSTPRSRPEALQAPRAERSSSSGALTIGGSAWLAAAALLLLFALGSFGLAIAGIPGPAKPALLRHLRSRMTSKGLSRHPVDGTEPREQRGIRYRD